MNYKAGGTVCISSHSADGKFVVGGCTKKPNSQQHQVTHPRTEQLAAAREYDFVAFKSTL